MATRVRVQLNGKGIDEMFHSPKLKSFLQDLAEEAAERARSTAPVDTGEYRSSIEATVAVTDRYVGRVQSTDDKALLVEANTGNLARSIDAARRV